jgi:hypothetical protein
MKFLIFIALIGSSLNSFAYVEEEVANIQNESLRMCVQNAENSYNWTWQIGGTIKECLSARLNSISFDDCEIAGQQLFSKPGINEAVGICIDHFINNISVERCFEASDRLFGGKVDLRKLQCLQANLDTLSFDQCSRLADQVGNRAHRLCAETIPNNETVDEETSQNSIAQ